MGVNNFKNQKKPKQFVNELLSTEAGLGHLCTYWDPKLSRVIINKRNKIHLLNLEKSSETLNQAIKLIYKMSGNVCFINTKEKLDLISKEAAFRCLQPVLTKSWVNGLLTNNSVLQKKKISMLFVINGSDNSFIINEGNKLNIPVISLNDTDKNSHFITYPIFSNDNSRKIQYFVSNLISDVIIEKSLLNFASELRKGLQNKHHKSLVA